jgi:hypothetical protein
MIHDWLLDYDSNANHLDDGFEGRTFLMVFVAVVMQAILTLRLGILDTFLVVGLTVLPLVALVFQMGIRLGYSQGRLYVVIDGADQWEVGRRFWWWFLHQHYFLTFYE